MFKDLSILMILSEEKSKMKFLRELLSMDSLAVVGFLSVLTD